MTLLFKIVNLLFILFLGYTIVYLCQTILSLYVASDKLVDQKNKNRRIKKIVPNKIAKMMKVSVIIPSYNEAKCIIGTIESLLYEDYPGLEIIVVNDGSTDDTEKMLVEYFDLVQEELPSFKQELKTNPIVKYFRRTIQDRELILVTKENGGKADALNCGLNLCARPLCLMLDADTMVRQGSIRKMASYFLMNQKTIVCAGAVQSEEIKKYPHLSLFGRALVAFQTLEYYRTFYLQRILFDSINANIIVSGAFAMFDSDLVKKAGGYHINTIGEDMELTMRLHAFCASQGRDYHISYAPEALCITQLPFTYKDFYNQRRRWQIGMLQSMKLHTYMLGNGDYGWAGIMAGSFFLLYELASPFIEIVGLVTLILAHYLNILSIGFTIKASILYILVIILIEMILVKVIHKYQIEKINIHERIMLFLVSIIEVIFFHPLNVLIKLIATLTSYKYRATWNHLERIEK